MALVPSCDELMASAHLWQDAYAISHDNIFDQFLQSLYDGCSFSIGNVGHFHWATSGLFVTLGAFPPIVIVYLASTPNLALSTLMLRLMRTVALELQYSASHST